jgi:hypothetical protein
MSALGQKQTFCGARVMSASKVLSRDQIGKAPSDIEASGRCVLCIVAWLP